jgi:hypothetical protein
MGVWGTDNMTDEAIGKKSDEEADRETEELRRRADVLRPKYPELTFKQFLESTPPDAHIYVTDLIMSEQAPYLATPDILVHCGHENCGGPRIFRSKSTLSAPTNWNFSFLQYVCRNCESRLVRFSIGYCVSRKKSDGKFGPSEFFKLGQHPPFGPHTPSRLISLIGPDREIFLQGRRAENKGLGIGAFAYYRRVVENQKNRIIAEIAKVAKTLGSTPEVDKHFAAAINETRFSDSVAMIKDFMPQSLLISGQNPLTLLHSALSKGLHNPEMTDARCLQLAQSIRTVLAELAERAAEATKSTKEIESALSVLMSVPNISKVSPEILAEQPVDRMKAP